MGTNGYTCQKLGFDNRREFNLGLDSQKEEDSPFKYKSPLKQDTYWYKINGKSVTKEEYNAYENKPGGDEPGKSTNDPDPSGNKAKIANDRANNKASKRPTVLTEAQTKAKGQGSKPPVKRPPFKKASPLKGPSWKKILDVGQDVLMGAGMVPGFGIIPDAINTAVSGVRSGYAYATGNKDAGKKHALNMGLNATAMIPVAGTPGSAARLATKGVQATAKTAKKVKRGFEFAKNVDNTGKFYPTKKELADAKTKKSNFDFNKTRAFDSNVKPDHNTVAVNKKSVKNKGFDFSKKTKDVAMLAKDKQKNPKNVT